MTLPFTINGTSPIGAIIDGIMDARIPEAQKKALLERMKQEGGVISTGLRNDLAQLFEDAAKQERESRTEDAQAVLAFTGRKTTLTAEEQAEEDRIASASGKEQQEVSTSLENMILQMRGDVERIERDASGKQEGMAEADNVKTMAQIRNELGLDQAA